MSDQGWFAVDRAIWEHPAFADEKFSEREAFLWLVSEAAYKPWKVRIGSDVVEIQRGQLSHSLRFMAKKWKWEEPRVRRYLERLKKHEVILTEVWSKNDARGDARQTIITICNYEEYQSRIVDPDAGGDARTTRERRASDAKKNKETSKQDKGIYTRTHAWPDDYQERIWDLYPKKAEKKDSMAALEAVYKADKVPFEVITAGIEKLISHVEPQYHPALHRWLKKERWNDEYQTRGPPRRANGRGGNAYAELAFQFDQQVREEQNERNHHAIEIIPPDRR
ncbi:MAG TPA: hypothetical protein VEZ16_00215 [Microvirga sp.]|nr:hypothetical protein [Microvirga sp.]